MTSTPAGVCAGESLPPMSRSTASSGPTNVAVGLVTADRAKTRNLARDPRAVVHVLGGDFWSYASVACSARLGAVSTEPGDQAAQDLLALFADISGKPHPNPQEFFDVQVAEQRLLLSLTPESISGSGWTD